jgi:hypothetical protein
VPNLAGPKLVFYTELPLKRFKTTLSARELRAKKEQKGSEEVGADLESEDDMDDDVGDPDAEETLPVVASEGRVQQTLSDRLELIR